MAAVLRSAMRLTANHVDYFTYNILRGLRFLHSLGLAHGSVCPSNVWLNANDDIQLSHLCYMHPADVPIADEASAEVRKFYQGSDLDPEAQQHRALEVLESRSLGGAPGDMWAMGCFLVELLFRRRLLPGSDLEDQRRRIAQLDQELETLRPRVAGVDIDFQDLELRLETARGCLAMAATSRLTAEAMIQASWLAELHAVDDCPTSSAKFPWRSFASFAEIRVALMSLRRAAEAR